MDSLNWAGYVDVDKVKGHITEVFAEWTIPKASCPANAPSKTVQVQWAGIDGLGSSTVEQIGTESLCAGPGATPTYATWWEFFPVDPLHEYRSASAGDLIEAYVLYDPDIAVGGVTGQYTLTLDDITANYVFTKVGNPASGKDISAECISEAPSTSGGEIIPLTDYGTTAFSTCDATIGGTFAGIGAYSTVYVIDQISSTPKTVQLTSGLSRTDYPLDHFTVSWKAYS